MASKVVSTGGCSVAVISMAHPPLNAVAGALRRALLADLDAAVSDPNVDAIVLTGTAGVFATSLPIREIDDGIFAPDLARVCQAIEDSTKPVVAALEGHVAGGGMEIALAAHARVARPKARIGFPDLNIGLCPSAGTMARLPRLIGADKALRFLLDAVPHSADSPICASLIDRIAKDRPVLDEALALADHLVETGLWCRTRDRSEGLQGAHDYDLAVMKWRGVYGKRGQAERAILDCVGAARTMPYSDLLAKEAQLFTALCQTARSRGLRRVRYGEQQCTRLTPKDFEGVTRFAFYPASQTGSRIAGAAAQAAVSSVLVDLDEARAIQQLGDVRYRLTRQAAGLGLREETGQAIADRVTARGDLTGLGDATVVFVAGGDDPDLLTARLAEITPFLSDNAAVLCLTTTLDCQLLAPPTLAGRVMGLSMADMDFPARLAEVKISDGTSQAALATAQAALRKLGRVLLRSPAGLASITDWMFDALLATADRLTAAGVAPDAIDLALRGRGHARGAYEMLGRINGPAYLRRARSAGRHGRLSARLLHDGIAPPLEGRPNPMLSALADELRRDAVWTPPADLIVSAMIMGLVNAGCALIEKGVAERPLQIDIAMIQGWGHPRATGGPMAEADMMGLPKLVQLGEGLVKRFGAQHGDVWVPHPILKKLTADGSVFRDLDIDQGAQSAKRTNAASA